MMDGRSLPVCLVAATLPGGCTGAGGVYEGARQSNDTLLTPTERATQPGKRYEHYYDRNRPDKGS